MQILRIDFTDKYRADYDKYIFLLV